MVFQIKLVDIEVDQLGFYFENSICVLILGESIKLWKPLTGRVKIQAITYRATQIIVIINMHDEMSVWRNI